MPPTLRDDRLDHYLQLIDDLALSSLKTEYAFATLEDFEIQMETISPGRNAHLLAGNAVPVSFFICGGNPENASGARDGLPGRSGDVVQYHGQRPRGSGQS